MKEEKTVALTIEEGIATLVLDRPARLNAIDAAMLDGIDGALDAIEADAGVRVLVVRSASERFFCSGADVSAWGGLSPEAMASRWIRKGNAVFDRIERLDVPTIAMLSGIVLGGGLELALACDLRHASDDARLGLPEPKLGAIAGWNGLARLVQTVGLAHARELALFGEPVDADTAHAWGLVNGVHAAHELDAALAQIASTLARRSPASLSVTKRLLRAVSGDARDTLHEFAASVCKASPDAAEGLSAFREKREAVFRRHA
jgi:enoyl-CoA hydratase